MSEQSAEPERFRGWAWPLGMLWVGAGLVNVGYTFYNTTKPFTWADVTSGIEGLSAYPAAVQDFVSIAGWAWLVLALAVLIAGFIRFSGWRRGNWLRGSAWAGVWIAGVALLALADTWGTYPEQNCVSYRDLVCRIPSPAVVSWGELPICAAWLVLGTLMTWILAVSPARERGGIALGDVQRS